MSKPIVALIGRPNVGKSTLFNRIAGEHLTIVEDIPGTTRDRIYVDISWKHKEFTLVDTGGLDLRGSSDIEQMVKNQVEVAIEQADVIIFIVDVSDGVTIPDKDVADILRCSNKPIILAVNKCDNELRNYQSSQFHELAIGEPLPMSAYHALNITALLDSIIAILPSYLTSSEVEESVMKIAVVGRPNAGKSMLINAILEEERSIVSDVPGTTRDAIDTLFDYKGDSILLIDTGGIRRKGRIARGIEHYSVLRALKAIERADVVTLVTDVQEPMAAQDSHIAGYIQEALKGMILVVNKWDLMEDLNIETERLNSVLRQKLKFFPRVPIVYTSALHKQGIESVLNAAKKVFNERLKRYPTALVNSVIRQALIDHAPSSVKGKRLNIFYATQTEVNPPTFVFFVNDKRLMHFSYKRYLENKLRKEFGFAGTPLNIILKNR